jgi:isopenicillin-N N-acyltransferase-like protein
MKRISKKFFVLLAFLLVVAALLAACQPEAKLKPMTSPPATAAASEKEQEVKERKEFKVIECSGTPYEIGKQYGTACRDSIRKSIEGLVGGMGFMQRVGKEEVLATAKKYLPLVESFDPDMIQMLKGQAEGAGVTFDEVFALRCGTELNWYYQRLTTLCTSFAVTGKATKDGKTIIGQTYDWGPGTAMDLVKTKYNNSLEQLSLVIGAGVGGEVLMNSAGLGMVLNVMYSPAEKQALNVPFAYVISKAMRQERIGDALGVVCASGRSILHYTFASAEGDIISIETHPDGFNVLYPERDMLVHTNHYLTDRFKGVDNSFFMSMEGDSYIRLQRIKKLIDERYGELTPEIMMEFLSDHTDYPRSICKHADKGVNLGETIAAIIIVPEDGVMYIAYGQPCKYEFVKYQL